MQPVQPPPTECVERGRLPGPPPTAADIEALRAAFAQNHPGHGGYLIREDIGRALRAVDAAPAPGLPDTALPADRAGGDAA